MRNGFKVYDSDTHVNPAAEVLERYVDPGFRPRLPELAPYRFPVRGTPGGTDQLHVYRVGTKSYRRILGEAEPHPSFTGRGTNWQGSKAPRHGVQDDQAANRVQDMDDEGADVHFLIPTSWTSAVGLEDVEPRNRLDSCLPSPYGGLLWPVPGALDQYDRGLGASCGRSGAGDPSVGYVEVGRGGDAAVRQGYPGRPSGAGPHLAGGAGLRPGCCSPQLHLDAAVLPRLPGSLGQYFSRASGLASLGRHALYGRLHRAGILDRYPNSAWACWKAALAGCLSGPSAWTNRPGTWAAWQPLKHVPSEYLTSGRFFCSIEMHEGEEMFNHVTNFLGDDVLMYASDYPHSECHFPDSIDNVLRWSSLKPETQHKLFWDNAIRFYKQT